MSMCCGSDVGATNASWVSGSDVRGINASSVCTPLACHLSMLFAEYTQRDTFIPPHTHTTHIHTLTCIVITQDSMSLRPNLDMHCVRNNWANHFNMERECVCVCVCVRRDGARGSGKGWGRRDGGKGNGVFYNCFTKKGLAVCSDGRWKWCTPQCRCIFDYRNC